MMFSTQSAKPHTPTLVLNGINIALSDKAVNILLLIIKLCWILKATQDALLRLTTTVTSFNDMKASNYASYADKESQLTYVSFVEEVKHIVKPEDYTYQDLLPFIDGMQGFVGISFGKETPWGRCKATY
ncbi:hypothetical protein EB796_002937 [Bugula neritina]|uniref:Uncharacterized protein n=1 Tax=Bugula neritina TaxID=10212 RepID=A0A7J7KKZ7_BUGNE|nr:hypothetical protein EB796_002937 [Bugula neritina]